jgi:hypothetical protein
MLGVLQARALVGSPWWDLPLDQRNQAIYAENQARPLAEVRQEAAQVYEALLKAIEALEEEDLHDPARFPGMPPDWKPWELLANNTYEHYLDHLPANCPAAARQTRRLQASCRGRFVNLLLRLQPPKRANFPYAKRRLHHAHDQPGRGGAGCHCRLQKGRAIPAGPAGH